MKIAIVKLSAMGDIVHAMATLQFIKREIPDARIDWIVEHRFASVLEDNFHIDRILPVNLQAIKKNKSKLMGEIKRINFYARNKYDIVIDMQGLMKSAIVSRSIGPSVGFSRKSIREKSASLFYKKSFHVPYEENVIHRNMKLISKALDIDYEDSDLQTKNSFLFFTANEQRKTLPYLTKSKKNIIYIMGSSWESKIYPKENLINVIKGLGENALLVWGDGKEYNSARYVSKRSKAVLLPSLTIGELKALIAKADLVIGGDSGPTHFAWALNRPSITLFGPTPGYRNTLEGKYNRVICSLSEVNPMKLNREDYSISQIAPNEIIKVGKELLEMCVTEHQERM